MEQVNIVDAMESERQRLTAELDKIAQKRIELEQQEQSIKIELSGIQAYFDAKMGKLMARQSASRTSQPRGPRKTGIRQQVLDTITAAVEGISRVDLLAKMGAKGDKSMEQAISNAIVALKKDNKVVSGERGTYKSVPSSTPTEPKAPRRVKKEEATTT